MATTESVPSAVHALRQVGRRYGVYVSRNLAVEWLACGHQSTRTADQSMEEILRRLGIHTQRFEAAPRAGDFDKQFAQAMKWARNMIKAGGLVVFKSGATESKTTKAQTNLVRRGCFRLRKFLWTRYGAPYTPEWPNVLHPVDGRSRVLSFPRLTVL